MLVRLVFYDIDQHDLDCDCGDCNGLNHKSYGVAVVPVGKDEPLFVEYAPSEFSAYHNAGVEARSQGHTVVLR